MLDTPQLQTLDKDSFIMIKLGSIEAQLKALNDKLEVKERDQDEEIKNLKKDVGALKDARKWQLGFAAGISFVVGLATSLMKLPWQNLT